MTDLHVTVLGEGEPVVMVHGTGGSGEQTWMQQVELADHWQLILPDRRGYGRSPHVDRIDFAKDGQDVAELLGGGAHLVGHSYGGVGALEAASSRPDAVWSLTVLEPPLFGSARGNPDVEALVARLATVFDHAAEMEPEEFDARFDAALGFEHPVAEVDAAARPNLDAARRERPPWESTVDLRRLRDAGIPCLVVSGDWHPAFDAVCDVLTTELHADRAVFPTGHRPQQRPGFNERVTGFWRTASRR